MVSQVIGLLDDPDLSKANTMVSDILKLSAEFFSPSERTKILSEINQELTKRKVELDCLQI